MNKCVWMVTLDSMDILYSLPKDFLLRNNYLIIFITLLMHSRLCIETSVYHDNAPYCKTKTRTVEKNICVGGICFRTSVTQYYLECSTPRPVSSSIIVLQRETQQNKPAAHLTLTTSLQSIRTQKFNTSKIMMTSIIQNSTSSSQSLLSQNGTIYFSKSQNFSTNLSTTFIYNNSSHIDFSKTINTNSSAVSATTSKMIPTPSMSLFSTLLLTTILNQTVMSIENKTDSTTTSISSQTILSNSSQLKSSILSSFVVLSAVNHTSQKSKIQTSYVIPSSRNTTISSRTIYFNQSSSSLQNISLTGSILLNGSMIHSNSSVISSTESIKDTILLIATHSSSLYVNYITDFSETFKSISIPMKNATSASFSKFLSIQSSYLEQNGTVTTMMSTISPSMNLTVQNTSVRHSAEINSSTARLPITKTNNYTLFSSSKTMVLSSSSPLLNTSINATTSKLPEINSTLATQTSTVFISSSVNSDFSTLVLAPSSSYIDKTIHHLTPNVTISHATPNITHMTQNASMPYDVSMLHSTQNASVFPTTQNATILPTTQNATIFPTTQKVTMLLTTSEITKSVYMNQTQFSKTESVSPTISTSINPNSTWLYTASSSINSSYVSSSGLLSALSTQKKNLTSLVYPETSIIQRINISISILLKTLKSSMFLTQYVTSTNSTFEAVGMVSTEYATTMSTHNKTMAMSSLPTQSTSFQMSSVYSESSFFFSKSHPGYKTVTTITTYEPCWVMHTPSTSIKLNSTTSVKSLPSTNTSFVISVSSEMMYSSVINSSSSGTSSTFSPIISVSTSSPILSHNYSISASTNISVTHLIPSATLLVQRNETLTSYSTNKILQEITMVIPTSTSISSVSHQNISEIQTSSYIQHFRTPAINSTVLRIQPTVSNVTTIPQHNKSAWTSYKIKPSIIQSVEFNATKIDGSTASISVIHSNHSSVLWNTSTQNSSIEFHRSTLFLPPTSIESNASIKTSKEGSIQRHPSDLTSTLVEIDNMNSTSYVVFIDGKETFSSLKTKMISDITNQASKVHITQSYHLPELQLSTSFPIESNVMYPTIGMSSITTSSLLLNDSKDSSSSFVSPSVVTLLSHSSSEVPNAGSSNVHYASVVSSSVSMSVIDYVNTTSYLPPVTPTPTPNFSNVSTAVSHQNISYKLVVYSEENASVSSVNATNAVKVISPISNVQENNSSIFQNNITATSFSQSSVTINENTSYLMTNIVLPSTFSVDLSFSRTVLMSNITDVLSTIYNMNFSNGNISNIVSVSSMFPNVSSSIVNESSQINQSYSSENHMNSSMFTGNVIPSLSTSINASTSLSNLTGNDSNVANQTLPSSVISHYINITTSSLEIVTNNNILQRKRRNLDNIILITASSTESRKVLLTSDLYFSRSVSRFLPKCRTLNGSSKSVVQSDLISSWRFCECVIYSTVYRYSSLSLIQSTKSFFMSSIKGTSTLLDSSHVVSTSHKTSTVTNTTSISVQATQTSMFIQPTMSSDSSYTKVLSTRIFLNQSISISSNITTTTMHLVLSTPVYSTSILKASTFSHGYFLSTLAQSTNSSIRSTARATSSLVQLNISSSKHFVQSPFPSHSSSLFMKTSVASTASVNKTIQPSTYITNSSSLLATMLPSTTKRFNSTIAISGTSTSKSSDTTSLSKESVTTILSTSYLATSSILMLTLLLSSSLKVSPSTSTLTATSVSTTKQVSSTIVVPSLSPIGIYLFQVTFINVSSTINVDSPVFVYSMEKKLVDTYKKMKGIDSSVDSSVAVEIFETSISDTTVKVQFNASVQDAFEIFQRLSLSGLSNHLGYKVNELAKVKPTNIRWRYILGMILTDTKEFSLGNQTHLTFLDNRIAAVYRDQTKSNGTLTIKPRPWISEMKQGLQYYEFYLMHNEFVVNATIVADVFLNVPVSEFNVGILKAKVLPYAANIMQEFNSSELLSMRIKPESTDDIYSVSYKYMLADRLAEMYVLGQGNQRRKRRATGSVQTQVKSITPVQDNQAEVVFMVNDGGKGVSSSKAATVMQNVHADKGKGILKVQEYQKPEPYVVAPAAEEEVQYWIIGAVIGGVVFIVLICLLLVWRWKAGGPSKKITPTVPEVIEMEKKPVAQNDTTDYMKQNQPLSQPIAVKMETPLTSPPVPVIKRNESLRRKVQAVNNQPYGRQNPSYQYDEEYDEEECEEDDEEVEEEEDEEDEGIESEAEEEPIVQDIIRKSKEPRLPEYRKQNYRPKPVLEVVTKPQIHQDLQLPPPPSNLARYSPPEIVALPPTPQTKRPLDLTANVLESDDVSPASRSSMYSAGHVPSFGQLNDSTNLSVNAPVRFRSKIENSKEQDYLKPTGPLPALDLMQMSLISNPTLSITPPREEDKPKPVDPELERKAQLERERNKQRQREKLFSITPPSEIVKAPISPVPAPSINKKYWKKEQNRIDAVLDPDSPQPEQFDLAARKGRLRRRMRRKNKIYMHGDRATQRVEKPQKVQKPYLTGFKNIVSPGDSESGRDLLESEVESELSMRETRRRIHSLLDDTFTTLKKYQKQLLKDETSPDMSPITKEDGHQLEPSITPPRKYAGMKPALPEPVPAHGRASNTPSGKLNKRIIQSTYPSPYNPYNPFNDPMITWDPTERQRYMNQQFGFPAYNPHMMYGLPNQQVYMTPVQQRPDGLGNMVWSPYTPTSDNFTSAMKPMAASLPGQNTYSPISALGDYKAPTHSTTLDDIGVKSKNSQPLIRAIKEELLKLSHSANANRTRIQELNSTDIENSPHIPGS